MKVLLLCSLLLAFLYASENPVDEDFDFDSFEMDYFDFDGKEVVADSPATTTATMTASSSTDSFSAELDTVHDQFCNDLDTEAGLLVRAINDFDTSQLFRIIHVCKFPVSQPILHGLPPVAYAASTGNIFALPSLVQLYKALGADVHAPFRNNNMTTFPLVYASTLQVFHFLVREGANIDIPITDHTHGNTFKLIHVAVLTSSLPLVDALISLGADLTERTSNGFSALQLNELKIEEAQNPFELSKALVIKELITNALQN